MLGYAQGHASPTLALGDRLTDDQIEALTDAADAAARKADVDAMRDTLERLFLTGMQQAAAARSTPKIPVTVRYNAAGDGEADRFVTIVRLVPVTTVAYDLVDTKGASDELLHLLLVDPANLAAMRDAQVAALAAEYAEAEATALVDAGWAE